MAYRLQNRSQVCRSRPLAGRGPHRNLFSGSEIPPSPLFSPSPPFSSRCPFLRAESTRLSPVFLFGGRTCPPASSRSRAPRSLPTVRVRSVTSYLVGGGAERAAPLLPRKGSRLPPVGSARSGEGEVLGQPRHSWVRRPCVSWWVRFAERMRSVCDYALSCDLKS